MYGNNTGEIQNSQYFYLNTFLKAMMHTCTKHTASIKSFSFIRFLRGYDWGHCSALCSGWRLSLLPGYFLSASSCWQPLAAYSCRIHPPTSELCHELDFKTTSEVSSYFCQIYVLHVHTSLAGLGDSDMFSLTQFIHFFRNVAVYEKAEAYWNRWKYGDA